MKDRTGGGVDRLKNQSGKCEGSGRGGFQWLFEKIKVKKKNQKYENIVEMSRQRTQRVHTNYYIL